MYSSTTTCNSLAKVDLFNNCGKIVWGTLWGLWNNSIKFRFLVHSTLQYPQMHLHKIRSWTLSEMPIISWFILWFFYDIGTAMRKQKMTKHCYLYVYHRRYIPSYICIIVSDEGFTNTKHTFQRILCTRWHCPSWQYGCHIAKPLTCSVKLKQSQWSCHQCDTLSMQQLIQMILLFHWIFIMTMGMQSCRRSPACLLQLTMAVQSMWMTLRMSQSSSDHSVCNSQKENSEDSDPEYVVADDSDITDDDSSSSDTNEKQRKCCCLHTQKLISLFCTCKKPRLVYYACCLLEASHWTCAVMICS